MPGSLIKGWREWDKEGAKSAVVLIDEQGNFGSNQPQLMANQCAILQLVNQFDNAIACFVELNPKSKSEWLATNPKLTQWVNQDKQQRISKAHFSAFDDTSLSDHLIENNVEILVVMGHIANHCVKQSIFGGPRKPTGSQPEDKKHRPGAVDANGDGGYIVLTSQTVVSGPIGTSWRPHPKVILYDHI